MVGRDLGWWRSIDNTSFELHPNTTPQGGVVQNYPCFGPRRPFWHIGCAHWLWTLFVNIVCAHWLHWLSSTLVAHFFAHCLCTLVVHIWCAHLLCTLFLHIVCAHWLHIGSTLQTLPLESHKPTLSTGSKIKIPTSISNFLAETLPSKCLTGNIPHFKAIPIDIHSSSEKAVQTIPSKSKNPESAKV